MTPRSCRNPAGTLVGWLVNNFNDGLAWVVLPVLLVDHGVSVADVGYIKALYPFMWAAGMIGTGRHQPAGRPGSRLHPDRDRSVPRSRYRETYDDLRFALRRR